MLGLLAVLCGADFAGSLLGGVPASFVLVFALLLMLARPWPSLRAPATGLRLRKVDRAAIDAVDVLFVLAFSRLSGLVAGSWDWPWELGLVVSAAPPLVMLWRWMPPHLATLRAAFSFGAPDFLAVPGGTLAAIAIHAAIGRAASLQSLTKDPSTTRLVVACIVVTFVGCALDEVLYRFALPLTLTAYLGRWLVPVLAVVYGAPFFGYWSPRAGAAFVLVGAVLGWARRHGLSLTGAMLGHTALSIGLLLLA